MATMNRRSNAATSNVLRAALAMAPEIAEAADEIERERCLPARIVESMKRAGVFGMAMPIAWGGTELNFPEQLRVVEALSRSDGSVGWCAMTGSLSGFVSAWLEDRVARELFRDASCACAGSLLFAGEAKRGKGGYRVSGRWPFNSGCRHATVFVFTCRVLDEAGDHSIRPGSRPAKCVCYLPASQVRILDTWESTGLRGTGSHDVEVHGVFVPEECVAPFPTLHSYRTGPLYIHPGPAAYVLPAVALGIARHAIDEFVTVASSRSLTMASLAGKRVLLRESSHAQVTVAQAEGLVASARSLVYDLADEVWNLLVRGKRLPRDLRARCVVAATNAYRSCVKAVDLLYHANGGSSVYSRSPLDRCFRDIHTANQHHFVSTAFDEKAGRVLLGLEIEDELF